VTTTEQWAQWEKQVINGVFPLHRAVSFSDHSAVFLTEYQPLNLANALLKLVPALPTLRDTQLAYWTTAAGLAHPNLIRLLEAGRCQIKGLQFLFVVMEYAEQSLARLLTQRSLGPLTLRTLLRPILTSMSFLHRNGLVHGGLKPSNILLTNRRVKLSSDTVRPAGESAATIAAPSVYDPPEARDGSFTTAGDVWSLGVFMVEALTQRQPSWRDRHAAVPVLPESLPSEFTEIVQQCLNRDPSKRPTIEELATQAAGITAYPVLSPPEPDVPAPASWLNSEFRHELLQQLQSVGDSPVTEPAADSIGSRRPPGAQRRLWLPLTAAAVTVSAIASVAVWASLRPPPTQTSETAGTVAAPDGLARTVPDSAETGSGQPTDTAEIQTVVPPPSVLHEEAPSVPPGALKTVHGHIKFAVRVGVDSSGNVIDASLASHSPSRYFTRVALETARRWRFVAANDQLARHWTLWFEFTREEARCSSATSVSRAAQ
jgi:TonB family protein